MATSEWFMAIGGQQIGPVTEADVVNAIKSGSADRTTLVFVNGMANWTPLGDVDEFRAHLGTAAPPPLPRGAAAPPPRARTRSTTGSRARTCSTIEVELDPGESVVAEAGALMYMTAGIQMETIFGDGSGTEPGQGPDGSPARRGQAHPHRREPVHDRVHRPGRQARAGGLRRAVPRPDPGDGPQEAGRRAGLPEGLLPVRGEGRLDRDRLPEEDRRGPLRRRGLHHAAPAGRRPRLRPRRRHC